jgi:hypothetical protein
MRFRTSSTTYWLVASASREPVPSDRDEVEPSSSPAYDFEVLKRLEFGVAGRRQAASSAAR